VVVVTRQGWQLRYELGLLGEGFAPARL